QRREGHRDHEACAHDHAEHRRLVHQHDDGEQHRPADGPGDDTGAHLAEGELHFACFLYFPCCDTPDGNGEGLCAGVSGHTADDGDESAEYRHLGQCIFKCSQHRRRDHSHECQADEPRQPFFGCRDGGIRRRFDLTHTGEPGIVLARLFVDDIHDVIGCDDADQVILVIDDRHGKEVVVPHDLRNILLVVRHTYGYDALRHDVPDVFIIIGDDEFTEGHDTGEAPLLVHHEHVVDRLRTRRLLFQMTHGIADCHERCHADELGRHDTAGGVLLIVQEGAYFTRILPVHQGEERSQLLVLHLIQYVHCIIVLHRAVHMRRVARVHLIEDLFELLGLAFEVVEEIGNLVGIQEMIEAP